LPLAELCKAISKCLKFGGRTVLCHRADRLVDVIVELKKNNIEPKRLQFLARKEGGEPYLLLVEGVKGGKPGLKMQPTEVNRCSTL
jgi:tRNA1(Val) A37 N6-methylase TrmN6